MVWYWVLTDWWVFPFLIGVVLLILIAFLIQNRG